MGPPPQARFAKEIGCFGMAFAPFPTKTQRVPVSKINEAFARLESGKAGNRGVRGADF